MSSRPPTLRTWRHAIRQNAADVLVILGAEPRDGDVQRIGQPNLPMPKPSMLNGGRPLPLLIPFGGHSRHTRAKKRALRVAPGCLPLGMIKGHAVSKGDTSPFNPSTLLLLLRRDPVRASLCASSHSVNDGKEWHRVYCFAEPDDAAFMARFGGERFDPA